jgi:hypothetical protein
MLKHGIHWAQTGKPTRLQEEIITVFWDVVSSVLHLGTNVPEETMSLIL